MSNSTPTRETLAKAMSRKPVEGYTPGPWLLRTVKTSCGRCHKILDEIRPDDGHSAVACIYDDDTSLDRVSSDERAATAVLITSTPDLQAENQVLQAAVRDVMASLHQSVAMLGQIELLMLNNEHDKLPVLGPSIWDSRVRSLQTLALLPIEGEKRCQQNY